MWCVRVCNDKSLGVGEVARHSKGKFRDKFPEGGHKSGITCRENNAYYRSFAFIRTVKARVVAS
jgi:hypothetical protein